jgi:hypothetical protein
MFTSESAPFIISMLLAVGALVATPSALVYSQNQENKAAKWSTLSGAILFMLALGASITNNALAGGMILIGTILLSVCGYYYNKVACDDPGVMSKKKSGLISGLVIGIAFFTVGVSLIHTRVNLSTVTGR